MKHLIKKYKLFESNIDSIVKKCEKYNIKKYEIDDDGLLTVYGNVEFYDMNTSKTLKELPLKFKEVHGNFLIYKLNITSLKGSPEVVHKGYYVEKTLIKNFKYCPKEVNGVLYVYDNKNMEFLEEFPSHVGRDVYMPNNGFKSLYGCIDYIKFSFIIPFNKNLESLKYGPVRVDEDYDCCCCDLTTLYGAPKHVGISFYCEHNKLNSLQYSPEYIGGSFCIANNNVKSFYHFPNFLGGHFLCHDNPIYDVWKLFKDKNYIKLFNEMKIINSNGVVDNKKLNIFLKKIGKDSAN